MAFALFALATRAWIYARDARSAVLTAAFGLFAAKAAVLAAGLMTSNDWQVLLLVSIGFDLGIVVAFWLASLR